MIHKQVSAAPTAAVAVNRNRLKMYGQSVYLKDGANYEIELFNPLQVRVKATIELDGVQISSSGIVLRPGERVYLERWIDSPKKFQFSTYHVENSAEARSAIVANGNVRVTFYEEYTTRSWGGVILTTVTATNTQPYWVYSNTVTNGQNYSGGTYTGYQGHPGFQGSSLGIAGTARYAGNQGSQGFCGPAGNNGALSTNTFLSACNTQFSAADSVTCNFASAEIETGRSEMGEYSTQGLQSVNGDFNSYPHTTVSLIILPESQKPIETDKIRSYCTECGTRVRAASWKFCPNCGEKR